MDVILNTFQENFGNKDIVKPETVESIENFKTQLIGVRNKLQETKDISSTPISTDFSTNHSNLS